MALTQVKSDGIATGAVTATQIATGAVTANDLEDSGVSAGTYGSSSAIPAITVDAKGRVTSASTSSIDSTSISNGTSSVSVIEDANIQFTRGGTNQLEVDGSGLLFQDSKKIRMGGSADLEIFHDGSHSYVKDAGTGTLRIEASEVGILSADGTETMAQFVADGAVSLRHNNVEKLATTSSGIDVTGTVTCDGLTCEGTAIITSGDGSLKIQDSNSTGDSAFNYIYGANSDNSIRWYLGQASSGNQDLYVQNQAAASIRFATNGSARAYINSSGHLVPAANNTYDLGTSSERWRNVYTNDLNLSNEGSTNDVDGTWGSWTIQEGEDDLFLLNRRNGKKYKFSLTEVN